MKHYTIKDYRGERLVSFVDICDALQISRTLEGARSVWLVEEGKDDVLMAVRAHCPIGKNNTLEGYLDKVRQ